MKTIFKLSLNSIKNSKISSFVISLIFFTINFILIFLSLDFINLYIKFNYSDYGDSKLFYQAMFALGAVYFLILLLSCLTLRTISGLRVLNIRLKISQFKALGATSKQLNLFVFFVYTILLLFTLPFIFLFFYALVRINNYLNTGKLINLNITLRIVLFSSFISFIIINLSIIKAYNIIKKITPLGLKENISVSNTKNETFKSFDRLNVYSIAKANIFRDRDYMYKTIITLSFSGIIFLTTSIILNNIKFDFFNHYFDSEILHIKFVNILNIACSFIGLINYFNIVINNVIKNKEKIGTYKVIGIKNKNIIRIQLIETFYYSICATAVSLVSGNMLGCILYSLQKENLYFYNTLQYEIYPVILIVITICIGEVIIYYFSKHFLKSPITDVLKNSN